MNCEYNAKNSLGLRHLEVGRFSRPVGGWMHEKTVPYTIIAQVIRGSYEISDSTRKETIAHGEAFLTGALLPLRILHRDAPDPAGLGRRMEVRWVHFHFTLYDSVDATSLLDLPLRLTTAQAAPFGEIIAELLALPTLEASPEPTASARRLESAARILRLLTELAPRRPDADERLASTQRLLPALTLIRRKLKTPPSLAELAKAAYLSVPRFHAVFKTAMGCSPATYARRVRLTAAGRILERTEAPLEEIADETGFSSAFHLSREFKKLFGVPPQTYRTRHKQSAYVASGGA